MEVLDESRQQNIISRHTCTSTILGCARKTLAIPVEGILYVVIAIGHVLLLDHQGAGYARLLVIGEYNDGLIIAECGGQRWAGWAGGTGGTGFDLRFTLALMWHVAPCLMGNEQSIDV